MVKLTPLSNWLNDAPEQVIAVHKDSHVTTADFLNRVSSWTTVIDQQQVNSGKWAVYHHDAFEFLAILFALWQLDITACIPGDNRPGTATRLKNTVVGFIGDFPSINTAVDSAPFTTTINRQWQRLPADFKAIEIYTSGSTGEPKSITKTIKQLDNENQCLAQLWPVKQDCIVLTTVSHQHLYGMTFRLFLPFILGQPFARQLCNYSEDIYYQGSFYSSFLLVSSPSHLGRLTDNIDWHKLGERCEYILSSSAPLLRADSLKISALWNRPVREIYGSSETGAIAWRSQKVDRDDARWQLLPNSKLIINSDGTVQLSSNFLATDSPVHLADTLSLEDDGTFSLLGRQDSIVKIEGKRVSLSNIEQLLVNSALINTAKAIVLQRKRVEVALVIELTEHGREQLKTLGRKVVIAEFKTSLANELEAVVLPRRWRFVNELPTNQQGKVVMNDLVTLFETTAEQIEEAV